MDHRRAGLTHVDESGAARMVDVSGKDVTARTASASGRVLVSPEVVGLLRGAGVPKGDTLAVARLAGIMGAKQTPSLIPLCHPLAISSVTVDLVGRRRRRRDPAPPCATTDRTGVEMEALTAVAVAALTVIDMVKAVDKARRDHRRPRRDQDRRQVRGLGPVTTRRDAAAPPWSVASNRAAAGVYDDETGPLIVDFLRRLGFAFEAPGRRARRRAGRRSDRRGGRRRRPGRAHHRRHRADARPTAPPR